MLFVCSNILTHCLEIIQHQIFTSKICCLQPLCTVLAIQFFVCNFPLAFFKRSTNSFTHMHAQHTGTQTHRTHTHVHLLFHFSLRLCATVQQSFLRRKFISACARFTWSARLHVSVCACVCWRSMYVHNKRQLISCDLYTRTVQQRCILHGARGEPK